MNFPAKHLLIIERRRKVTVGERQLQAFEGVLKLRSYRGAHVGNARKAYNSALLGHLAQRDRACLADGGGSGRSQGFAMRFAFHRQPLPLARTDQIPTGLDLLAEPGRKMATGAEAVAFSRAIDSRALSRGSHGCNLRHTARGPVMATLAPSSLPTARVLPPREHRFFAITATVMALTVVAGFLLQVSLGRSTFASPLRVHLHAFAFMGWVAIFLTQSWFATRGSLALHRRLGWIGAGWIVLMLGTASWVIVTMMRRGTVPFFFTPQQLLVGDPLTLLCFAGLTWSAVALRKRTEWHARLHICAMAAIIPPAFGRMIPMPLLVPYAFEVTIFLGLMFPIAGVIRDLRKHGSVHRAWLAGIGAILATLVLTDVIAYSPAGSAFYRTVVAGSPGAAIDGLAYPPPPSSPLLTGR